MIPAGEGVMVARFRELQDKIRRLTPASTPGLLTQRTSLGVQRRPISSAAVQEFPFQVVVTDFLGTNLVCQTFRIGFADDDGNEVLDEVYYLVEPPPQFFESNFYRRIDLPEFDLRDRSVTGGAQVQPWEVNRQYQIEHPDVQYRVISMPPREETPAFTDEGTRDRKLSQIWWPLYTLGGSKIWISRTGQASTLDLSDFADILADKPYRDQLLRTGYFDMNVDARRWTNHRDVVDDVVVNIPSFTISVPNGDDEPTEVETGDLHGTLNDLATKTPEEDEEQA